MGIPARKEMEDTHPVFKLSFPEGMS
jgi:hypothetical protein